MSAFSREQALQLSNRFAEFTVDIVKYLQANKVPGWMRPMALRYTLLALESTEPVDGKFITEEDFKSQMNDFVETELSQIQ